MLKKLPSIFIALLVYFGLFFNSAYLVDAATYTCGGSTNGTCPVGQTCFCVAPSSRLSGPSCGCSAPINTPTPTPSPTPTATPTPSPTPGGGAGAIGVGTTPVPTGTYVPDSEVTFVGQNAARAGLLLDWTLSAKNFGWVYLMPGSGGSPSQNPLQLFWLKISYIVYAMLAVVLIVAAIVIIATRGRSLSVRRFIIRFIVIVILVYFSWSIIQFLYQLGDIIQLFFLKSPTYAPNNISQKDLLFVGWDYATFVGLRLADPSATESAFIALLLVKLTAITYYVMVGILLLRKIIMWFFIILSPVFPLLLFFSPVRNTAKIWIGEFFRWLLYAPLFSILLAGLVSVWVNYIPLNFTDYTHTDLAGDTYNSSAVLGGQDPSTFKPGSPELLDRFPTAINILLGGPKQQVGINNSINYVETFAEYIVALMMLWVVILLPFILLQIFLDYLNSFSINENAWVQQLIARSPAMFNPPPPSPISPQPPSKYKPTGLAKSLPFGANFKVPVNVDIKRNQPVQIPVKINSELMRLTNLNVPTMRDIAQFEKNMIVNKSSPTSLRYEQTLSKIANPTSAIGAQQDTYRQIRGRLMVESQKGNVLAKNILQAASLATATSVSKQTANTVQQTMNTILNPTIAASQMERTKANEIRQTIVEQSEKGNTTASLVVSTMNTINKTEIESISQMIQKIATQSTSTLPSTLNTIVQTLHQESASSNPVAVNVLAATKLFSQKGKVDLPTVTKLHDQLKQESRKGNKLATELLASAQSPDIISQVQRLLKTLQDAKQKGDPLAVKVLELLAQNGVQISNAGANLPSSNRIQTVSIEDYEAVRQMWADNYTNMDVPETLDGRISDRKSWLISDIEDIAETISLLSSQDQLQVSQGMQRVSGILPFLLIGGFSQSEIVAYLKAKAQAAKEVLANLGKQEEEEDTLLSQRTTSVQQDKLEGHLDVSVNEYADEKKDKTVEEFKNKSE